MPNGAEKVRNPIFLCLPSNFTLMLSSFFFSLIAQKITLFPDVNHLPSSGGGKSEQMGYAGLCSGVVCLSPLDGGRPGYVKAEPGHSLSSSLSLAYKIADQFMSSCPTCTSPVAN